MISKVDHLLVYWRHSLAVAFGQRPVDQIPLGHSLILGESMKNNYIKLVDLLADVKLIPDEFVEVSI